MTLSVLTERRVYSPPGYNGGNNGKRGHNTLIYTDGRKINLGSKNTVMVVAGVSDILSDILFVLLFTYSFGESIYSTEKASISLKEGISLRLCHIFHVCKHVPSQETCETCRIERMYKNFESLFKNYNLSPSNCFFCNSLKIN